MTGYLVGSLMMLGYLALTGPGGGTSVPPGGGALTVWVRRRIRRIRWSRQVAVVQPELPLFVYQLTALLRAGRSPQQLWQDIALVYASEGGREPDRPADTGGFAQRVLPVLWAAQQAATIGAGVPEVLRRAANQPSPKHWRPGRARTPPDGCAGLWHDLAVCVEISDRSGAPLADVLGRYAAQLEQTLNSAAARSTAVAGPAATARLLGWLPMVGLALGYLTGAQPLAILFGSVPGLVLLCVGGGLMVCGRFWSDRLVSAAARAG